MFQKDRNSGFARPSVNTSGRLGIQGSKTQNLRAVMLSAILVVKSIWLESISLSRTSITFVPPNADKNGTPMFGRKLMSGKKLLGSVR